MQPKGLNSLPVRVYKVRLYDVINDKVIISRRMATEAGAARMGGQIIEDTGILIDPADLEGREQWTAIGFEPS